MDQYLTTRSADKLGGPGYHFLLLPFVLGLLSFATFGTASRGQIGEWGVSVGSVFCVVALFAVLDFAIGFRSRNRAVAIMRYTFKGQELLEQGDQLELETAEIEKRIRAYEESATALETKCKTLLPREFKEVDASFMARIGLRSRMSDYLADRRKRLISNQTALLREICDVHSLSMPEVTTKKAST